MAAKLKSRDAMNNHLHPETSHLNTRSYCLKEILDFFFFKFYNSTSVLSEMKYISGNKN